MENFNNLLERLKEHYKVSDNLDLCEKMEVKPNTFSTWVNRKAIPLDRLFTVSEKEKLSLNWILFGIGEKYLSEIIEKNNLSKTQNELKETQTLTIHVNTSKYSDIDELKNIIELLEYASKLHLNKIKTQLEKMKNLVEEN